MILNGASHASYLSIHGIWRAANVTLFSPLYLFVCLSLALTDDDNYKGICAKKSLSCLIIVILTLCNFSQNIVWKQQIDRRKNTDRFFSPRLQMRVDLICSWWGDRNRMASWGLSHLKENQNATHTTQTLSGAQFTGALIITCFSLLSRISPGSRVSTEPSFLGFLSDVFTVFDKTLGGFRESCNSKKAVCVRASARGQNSGGQLQQTETHKNILDHTWFLSLHQIVGLGKIDFSSNHDLHLNNWTI